MTALAIDCSNYTSPLTVELIQGWQANDVRLVLIQAFPPFYVQHAEQRQQTAVCVAVGMPFDNYIYDYLGDPTWRDVCLDGIDQIGNETSAWPRKVWLDEEDTETEQGWSTWQRRAAVRASISVVQARQKICGIYTGAWWWIPKTGNLDASDVPLWDSDYDGVPDTEYGFSPYGGWTERRIKQYQGTSKFLGVDGVDLNVLSAAEVAELEGSDSNVDDTERQAYEDKINGLTVTVADIADRLGDELLAEAKRPAMRKTVIRNVVKQMEAERAQAVGPRP